MQPKYQTDHPASTEIILQAPPILFKDGLHSKPFVTSFESTVAYKRTLEILFQGRSA